MSVISIATLWLAVTDRLVLYIHPRYEAFTVVMAVAGLVLAVAHVLRSDRSGERDHGHDHEHAHDEPPEAAPERLLSIGALALSAALAAGAVLLPPATLSAATASQRDITTAQVSSSASLDDAASADTATFLRYTVAEWSSLLAQTSDPAFFAGKPADVLGFVTPDPDAADVFYVSRFTITCCAVDAQPVGVPVYLPDWQTRFAADDWVQVSGEFAANRSADSTAVIALVPTEVTGADEPSDPYLY